uniref:Uncharacterized protein n=1 Tax=Pipistrellus kuhlii TaxID=59472 RepID=A0A7J7T1R8_PIPKU|nr:hypothetical protein mPipKuh1_009727 [Pipistrellus kuhlii]
MGLIERDNLLLRQVTAGGGGGLGGRAAPPGSTPLDKLRGAQRPPPSPSLGLDCLGRRVGTRGPGRLLGAPAPPPASVGAGAGAGHAGPRHLGGRGQGVPAAGAGGPVPEPPGAAPAAAGPGTGQDRAGAAGRAAGPGGAGERAVPGTCPARPPPQLQALPQAFLVSTVRGREGSLGGPSQFYEFLFIYRIFRRIRRPPNFTVKTWA